MNYESQEEGRKERIYFRTMNTMTMLLVTMLMFACASCEDTRVKAGLQERKYGKETYADDLNIELVAKIERMEKTLQKLMNQNSIASNDPDMYITNDNPDINQMAEDIEQNRKDIGHLRNVVDINEATANNEISKLTANLTSLAEQQRADVEKLENNIGDILNFLSTSLHPVGSIIAWIGSKTGDDIPSGWQRCDGSVIERGLLAGENTPNLNKDELFLRGGLDSAVGTVQEDAVQDHHHVDNGHKHTDSGHRHNDKGHSHMLDHTGHHVNGWIGVADCKDAHTKLEHGSGWCMIENWDTFASHANIETGHASISKETAGLGGVTGGRKSTETRPKNMKVVYIMRIE